MGKRKRNQQSSNKKKDESLSLSDQLNPEMFNKLKVMQQGLKEEEKRKQEIEEERKREERRQREKNKSFEELFNESNLNWSEYK